ncbi:MAG TPA: CBS domain-containing protein [Thermodesulfovibrionales bacterium]|jgi:CBS domain-containing protein|nr:CBS domain-containing protein [Thermodesulfovibrionales bacterium]
MKVVEIMTKKLETIEAAAPIYDAIEKMIDKRIRSLLVKPNDDKDVHGVITVRDVVNKALAKNLDLTRTKVGEITSKPLVCVDKGMDVEYAINLMSKFNITRVFVNDGKEIIGIISLLDVMSAELIKRAREGHRA